MEEGRRKTSFLDWLENDIPRYFAGRILPVNLAVAEQWGHLCSAANRPLPIIDSLLAATALERGLIMVTHNLRDFELSDVHVIDPWQETTETKSR